MSRGDEADVSARSIRVTGVVQGVGFRPFVHRLATECGLAGWVRNDANGVEIHVEGRAAAIHELLHRIRTAAPPAARITDISAVEAERTGASQFEIIASAAPHGAPTTHVSPDLSICDDCLCELRDPDDPRFAYPYINCTNCGPRYSIIERLPYDRPNTTMAEWTMCDDCRRQYSDPRDRRFHAQPVACPRCGPAYRLEAPRGAFAAAGAIDRAAALLRNGAIVAIKGVGGYHLACNARDAAAIERLRERKFRKERPFALMCSTLDAARALVELDPAGERLLLDVARPIVVAPARCALPGVAPDNPTLGAMLPYAPLHHLLFDAGAPDPLVVTSGNRSSEPIAFDDADARERLTGVADAFLVGERRIARRADDSVVAIGGGRIAMIRRARGFAPAVVATLPSRGPVLAVGPDLKNTVTLVIHGQAFMSPHVGDLGDAQTDAAFEQAIADWLSIYAVDPRELTVAHDLHPQYRSTATALRLPAREHIGVQHHHAHIAAVLAEHGLLQERVVGLALDGTGYGLDGAIWGGEFLVGSAAGGFERVAHLRSVAMPGGDAAATLPPQAAAGFLGEFADAATLAAPPFDFPRRFFDALELVRRGVRCIASSSAGRLFDAAAALCGFVRETSYEGQAAMWLEHRASAWMAAGLRAGGSADGARDAYPFDGLDHQPLLAALIDDRRAGRPVEQIAWLFHAGLARGFARKLTQLAAAHGVRRAALSGGVFQNVLLTNELLAALPRGLHVLLPEQTPVNDGGVSLGQAALVCAAPAPRHV